MPPKRPPDACHQTGLFRFSVIADLLARPPAKGELAEKLRTLSQKTYVDPLTKEEVTYTVRTLERWLSSARKSARPNEALQPKLRSDRNTHRALNDEQKKWLCDFKTENPTWDAQLITDNLRHSGLLGTPPSYSTVLRFLKSQGYFTHPHARRKAAREVRTFEVEHVGELWHMDFHHGSRMVVDEKGEYQRAICMAIIDDKSRLACHVQWFLNETAQVLVHGLIQAMQKRGMPRGFFTDNGSAMRAEELLAGLSALGIKAHRTLPYAAYQNGKQECFWKPLEGRLMRMIPKEKRLTLDVLNRVTQAWVEQDYQIKHHREINDAPLERFLNSPDVLRPTPSLDEMRRAFRVTDTRMQRRTDNTVTLEGVRFEVPQQYAHIEELTLRYARWDLGEAEILCPSTRRSLVTILPINRIENARGTRKERPHSPEPERNVKEGELLDLEHDLIPPYLRHLLNEHSRTHPLVGYLPIQNTQVPEIP